MDEYDRDDAITNLVGILKDVRQRTTDQELRDWLEEAIEIAQELRQP